MISINKHWTLFLDRDGVINEKLENDYVKKWKEFKFLPEVKGFLSSCSKVFGRIVIVTNQQGIGKGLYSHDDLSLIHRNMINEITVSGGRVDKVYYCPNLVSDKSINRKPEIGMALQAQNDFPEIDFNKSIMVGDSLSDMEFGKKVNMKTFFINTSGAEVPSNNGLIDFTVSKLKDLDFYLDCNP